MWSRYGAGTEQHKVYEQLYVDWLSGCAKQGVEAVGGKVRFSSVRGSTVGWVSGSSVCSCNSVGGSSGCVWVGADCVVYVAD